MRRNVPQALQYFLSHEVEPDSPLDGPVKAVGGASNGEEGLQRFCDLRRSAPTKPLMTHVAFLEVA